MRITIVLGAFLPVPTLRGGAIEKVWLALAEEFARKGEEVTVISRAMRSLPRQENLNGVNHLRVAGFDTPRSLFWLKMLDLVYSRRVRRVLPAADVIVTNTFWLPILVREPSHGRLYVHVGRHPKGQLRLYSHAARLQAPSRAIGIAIKSQVPNLTEKVRVIPYPFPGKTAKPPRADARGKIITYAGRLHPEKGVHLLVKAFALESATRLAGWRLRLVGPAEIKLGGGGPAYLEQLRGLAQEHPVDFTGGLFEPGALEAELQKARIFVYPSLAEQGETFGVAVLEAMAEGAAVIVSSLGCFRDFVHDGETGLIFDHRVRDPVEQLRERLVRLAANDLELERIAENGYRETARFSLSGIADRFLEDFRSVVSGS